ncbi:ATP-binding protein [Kitasatospora sp. NPDC093102]|uniref:ATP-binding protein n=1 Tax=Kitasatospora sp. NPDC093102 TaxID=3155069 RepID=UPI003441BCFC
MPGPLEKYSCWLPRHRKSVPVARQQLRDCFAGRPDAEPFLDTGELVLSELVTNAVLHASVPLDRLIFVHFELSSSLRIEVHDADATRPTLNSPTECDETGRGLFLVSQLAARWGCCPREGGIGKIVWAQIGGAQ